MLSKWICTLNGSPIGVATINGFLQLNGWKLSWKVFGPRSNTWSCTTYMPLQVDAASAGSRTKAHQALQSHCRRLPNRTLLG